MKEIKIIYDKYLVGDPITDEELVIGIKYLEKLNELLFPLGERFYLSWKEINRILIGLQTYQAARKSK